jgi:Protein of unknown function (DUF3325)
MPDAVLLASLFAANYCGLGLLASSQAKNWSRVSGTRQQQLGAKWFVRAVGCGLLIGSLVVAILRQGASFGTILWCTSLSVAAIAVAFTLTWRPRWLRVIVTPLLLVR